MLRLSQASWLALPAALLGGCPIYSDGCLNDDDCAPGYACDYPSGACVAVQVAHVTPGPTRCTTSSDCSKGQVCDRYLRCVTPGGEAGSDGSGATGGSAGTTGGSTGESGGPEGGSSAGR